jgi:hypothetical protein
LVQNIKWNGYNEEWRRFKVRIDTGLDHLFGIGAFAGRIDEPRKHVITCPFQREVIRDLIAQYVTAPGVRARLQSPEWGFQNTNFVETLQNIIRIHRPKGGTESAWMSRVLVFIGACHCQANRLAMFDSRMWCWETKARRKLEISAHFARFSLASPEFEAAEERELLRRAEKSRKAKTEEEMTKRALRRKAQRAKGRIAAGGKSSASDYRHDHNLDAADIGAAQIAAYRRGELERAPPPKATPQLEQEFQLGNMRVAQLKRELAVLEPVKKSTRGKVLKVQGKKPDLVVRLRALLLQRIADGGVVVKADPKPPTRCGFCKEYFHTIKKCTKAKLALQLGLLAQGPSAVASAGDGAAGGGSGVGGGAVAVDAAEVVVSTAAAVPASSRRRSRRAAKSTGRAKEYAELLRNKRRGNGGSGRKKEGRKKSKSQGPASVIIS